LIKHNHFLVNGKRVSMPSYEIRKDDVVEVAEKSRQVTKVMAAVESVKRREGPAYAG
jgi:small subunit ribosomal protein S4